MKSPKNGPKPGPQPLDLKRHYTTLTPEETQDIVETVADLIVNFVKNKGLDSPSETLDPGDTEKSDPEKPPAGRTGKKKERR